MIINFCFKKAFDIFILTIHYYNEIMIDVRTPSKVYDVRYDQLLEADTALKVLGSSPAENVANNTNKW